MPLEALEGWIAGVAARLKPGERIRLARKIGAALRRANAKRIAANVQPDGSAMEPRKRRRKITTKSGKARSTGKMFPHIRMAKALRVSPSADGVEVGFNNPLIAHTARVHHYGLVDYVGRTADGKEVRTRYPARALLGIAPEDRALIMDEVLAFLER